MTRKIKVKVTQVFWNEIEAVSLPEYESWFKELGPNDSTRITIDAKTQVRSCSLGVEKKKNSERRKLDFSSPLG